MSSTHHHAPDLLRIATAGDYDQLLPKLNLSQRQVPIVVRLPDEGLLRLAFEFRPERADLAEITARLETPDGGPLSETWMFRWTRE